MEPQPAPGVRAHSCISQQFIAGVDVFLPAKNTRMSVPPADAGTPC